MSDELPHQPGAKPFSLEIGPHDDGEFGTTTLWVSEHTGHTKKGVRLLLDSNKGHLPLAVDLSKLGEEGGD